MAKTSDLNGASQKTGIEWTNRTWNPTTGCDKISAGCKHCYAEPLAARLQAMGNPRYTNGFALTLHPDKVREPLGWRTPELVFVNSMSDMLHRDIPIAFILDCFDTMIRANWHTYQILTKRPERWEEVTAAVLARFGHWPNNVLPGATVENRKALPRLEMLAKAGDAAAVRMISVEPLLESLGPAAELAARLKAAGIGWAITGGEAGWDARPAELDWFREVRDACALAGVPFFHKQHGGVGVTKDVKRGGTLAVLDGQLHHAMPVVKLGAPPTSGKGAKGRSLPMFEGA